MTEKLIKRPADIDIDIIREVFGSPQSGPPPSDEALVQKMYKVQELVGDTFQREGNTMSHSEKIALVAAIQEQERREHFGGHINKWFLEEGPYSYDKYSKHMEFFEAGRHHRERIFMAANRVGKTVAGGYEVACHATGIYPPWWKGERFFSATDGWASGDTSQTTRDIVQKVILGEPHGTGMLPADRILRVRSRPGYPDAVDSVYLRHASGGTSILGFKSYEQGRRSFQGTAKHYAWMDEEPPMDVYNETLLRTMKVEDAPRGITFVTFTPIIGLTKFVMDFMHGANYTMPRE
jgi:phage terminase large subunit-like protein